MEYTELPNESSLAVPINDSACEDAGDCRICRDTTDEPLISPCACTGTVSKVHASCLQQWIAARSGSGADNLRCEICQTPYAVRMDYRIFCDRSHVCTAESCGEVFSGLMLLSVGAMTVFSYVLVFPQLKKELADSGPRAILFFSTLTGIVMIMWVLTVRRTFQRWRRAMSEATLLPISAPTHPTTAATLPAATTTSSVQLPASSVAATANNNQDLI